MQREAEMHDFRNAPIHTKQGFTELFNYSPINISIKNQIDSFKFNDKKNSDL